MRSAALLRSASRLLRCATVTEPLISRSVANEGTMLFAAAMASSWQEGPSPLLLSLRAYSREAISQAAQVQADMKEEAKNIALAVPHKLLNKGDPATQQAIIKDVIPVGYILTMPSGKEAYLPAQDLGFTCGLAILEHLFKVGQEITVRVASIGGGGRDILSIRKPEDASPEKEFTAVSTSTNRGHGSRSKSQGMATAAVISNDAFVIPTSNSFGQSFRLYDAESIRKSNVEEFYRVNHINQTYSFGLDMREKHLKLDKRVMSVWECCELLNECIDESDPDLDEPQIEHLLQTAEAIRRDHPNEDWFHLTGLIHDLGKVLLHPAFGEQPQWDVVGDTFPLGCAFDNEVVHSKFFKENLDYNDPLFSTKFGVYEEGCGLDKLIMSWGHDEYMYQVMKLNNTTLPPQALFIIRYHSFYSLHHGGAYTHFLNDFDNAMMPWLKAFQKYDLYSKSKVRVDVEKVKPYYLSLIEKYFPKTLHW